MPQSPYKEAPRIFICYRHDDSAGDAARLFERLVEHFGETQVFMDQGSIGWGADFGRVIEVALNSSDILIAMIGHHWLPTIKKKRLPQWHLNANEKDWVLFEIAGALDRNIHVIPILMHGTTMPKVRHLPMELKKLSDRNAVSLSNADWKVGVEELIQRLDKILAEQSEARRQWEQDAGARRHREEEQKKAAAETKRQELEAARHENKLQIERFKGCFASLVFTALAIGVLYFVTSYVLPDRAKRFVNERVGPIYAVPSPSPARGPRNSEPLRVPTPRYLTLPTPAQPTPTVSQPSASPLSFRNDKGIEFIWVQGAGFFGKDDVTKAQWKAVMGKNLRSSSSSAAADPVKGVSLGQAEEFIRKLNEMKDGYHYSLPTEAQRFAACFRLGIENLGCSESSTRGYFRSGFRVVATLDLSSLAPRPSLLDKWKGSRLP